MKGNLYLQGLLVAAVLLVVGLVPASASTAERAASYTHPGGVQFVVQGDYARAILTINGNGHSERRDFGKGRTPAVDLFDANGYALPDGNYRWQLQLVPGEADAERLRASARKNGGRATDAWSAQSGSFTIRAGSIAIPELVEAQAPRARTASTLGADLAAAPSRARAEASDSDNAVAYGAVERASGAPATRAADTAHAKPGRAGQTDGDGGTMVERAARAPESITHRKRTTSAEGSNGRPEHSKPNR